METLMQCSKILYDVEMADKLKEIHHLKYKISTLEKELDKIKTPKLLCKNHQEWHEKVSYILDYIYDNIADIQLVEPPENGGEDFFTGPGRWALTDRQEKFQLLKDLLLWLTKHEYWADKHASDMICDLGCILDNLKLHERYSDEERKSFVYNFFQDKLCERHRNSILGNIPHYRCEKCNIIYNDPYDSEDDGETFDILELCDTCYRNS